MNIKKLLRAFGWDVVMLLAFGGMLLYMSAPDLLVSFKPAVSFEQMLDGTEVKAGSHVEGDVLYALDYFASQSTYTRRSDGSRSSSRKSGNYYLIPTSAGYIGLKSRQSDVAALNALTDETFQFLESGQEPTSTVYTQGSVKVMSEKIAQYYREYLEDMGYSEAEIADMGEPLVIEYVSFGAVRVMSVIGLLAFAIALLILRRRYQRELRGSGLPKAEDLPDIS